MEEAGYDAFVSYRRSDGAATARWVRTALQNFRPPRSLGERYQRRLRVYIDTAYERGTTDFFERTIRPALMSSRWLVLIATPDAVLRGEDDLIMREVSDFCSGPNSANLIVVRGKGAFDGPLPADVALRFPNAQIIDLRNVGRFSFLNPLRASRISNELLKIVAAVLDVPAKDMPLLRQEEEQRQHARLGAAFGAVSSVALAVAALAVFALISRYQAQSALQDSIYSLSQLVQQSYKPPTIAKSVDDQQAQTAARGCDLLSKLDGSVGTRMPPLTRSLCLIVQGDGRLQQQEFELAEANYTSSLNIVDAAMKATPSQRLADARFMARDALVRLHVVRRDKVKHVAELQAIVAECHELLAPRPERDAATSAEQAAAIWTYEDRSGLFRRMAEAKQELARLASDNGRTDRYSALLSEANEAFASAATEVTGLQATAKQSDATIAEFRESQAWIAVQLAQAALDGGQEAKAARHLGRAVEFRKEISRLLGTAGENDFHLGRLLLFSTRFKINAPRRKALLAEATASLKAAVESDTLQPESLSEANRLLEKLGVR
ncbi:MAG: hypothetical protein K0U74_15215 [Alphaproteobacteria bacterium]|nr:hypothetical protein [Alphaproteobacteria bacterium]